MMLKRYLINLLKEESSDYTFKLLKFDLELCQPFILVVITPLMKRVHQMIPNAKDLVFIDSSSNMEEFNLRVFIIVTHSVCGALPLGIIITSDEQLERLKLHLAIQRSSIFVWVLWFFYRTEGNDDG